MQAKARIFFQKKPSKRTKDNLCPVKLCITYHGERKYYSIVNKVTNNNWQFLSINDIEKVSGYNPRGKFRKIKDEYERIKGDAVNIINQIPIFSFAQFEDAYLNKKTTWDNIFSALWSHIIDLKEEERFGYASSFESTIRAIKEFHTGKTFDFNPRKDKVDTRAKIYLTGKELRFVDITSSWLKKFEKWMNDQGKSNSTIGIYVRNIRVIFNLAIKKHKVIADYPFVDHKAKSTIGRKIALSAHQISLIANFEADNPKQAFYRDIFMFSFLASVKI